MLLEEASSALADPLPTPQLVLALVVAFSMLAIVLELVRRQKLREEYSILWIGTAVVLITLALSTGILTWLAEILQAQSLVSILYFGALVFLMLVALQFSVRVTKLTFRSRTLTQKIALLEEEMERLKEQLGATSKSTETPLEIPRSEPKTDEPEGEPVATREKQQR